jgi:selenocysteine-specific elongation factor
MHVIGTAGHVDHGKSTLVNALTGIDPDRLKEEKARGMTIDLGFAWMDLVMPDGAQTSVGIVDVPGHIDFIKNMLAGVGGIDAALLVIAADEGVMPQTREHLAILDLLAVPAGVVVLTKTDLSDDPDWLDLVELDVADVLSNTRLAAASIVRVSATTGAGLDELRRALATVLHGLPPRRNRGRPRLPIDRVFTLSGLGTVVTGTLSDGPVALGDVVEILPAGLTARVRGLQSHKRAIEQAEPGSRVAVNLSGVSTAEVHRGDVMARPGAFQPTTLVDMRFRLLHDAPRALAHNQRVDLFVGASEIGAYARVLGAQEISPGAEGWLQLRLDRPAVVVAGDRFVLRQPSPSLTLGGGEVLSPQPRRRWRRFDPAVLARFETLSRGAPDAILLQSLARKPFVEPAALLAASELDAVTGAAALDELRGQQGVKEIGGESQPLLVSWERWRALLGQIDRLLAHFHQQAPLRQGMPRGELRSRLQPLLPDANLTVRLFNAIVAAAQAEGAVATDDALVWQTGFAVQLSPAQDVAVARTLAAFAAAPFAPPNQAETLHLLGGQEELLAMLLEQNTLVRIGGDVIFRSDDLAALMSGIATHLRANGTITLAEVRDRFQTTRKYAQAVLEEMDARRITRREGEGRVLR